MLSRRTVRGGVKVALIAIVVVVPSVSASTRFYRGDFGLPIPSPDDPCAPLDKGRMDDAIIEIYDNFTINDLNLSIGLTHGCLMDLEMFLYSPADTMVQLNYWGNTSLLKFEGYRVIVFDDEAEFSIENAVEGLDGPYRPIEPLSAFDGENIYGEWRLRIYDGIYDDSGMLHSVELIVTVPEPGTVFLIGAGAILLRLKRRDR